MQLIIEAIFVGIGTVIIGSIVGYIISKYNSIDLPNICKKWNKNHIMEICLFITGFMIHIICELTGINKYYCKKGYACK